MHLTFRQIACLAPLLTLCLSISACDKVVFHSLRSGTGDVYTVNSDGSNLQNLTADLADERTPVYTPDGDRIVFVGRQAGDDEIYIMDDDGDNVINLSNNPGGNDMTPVISPAGDKIVYRRENSAGFYDLYIMNLDGSGKQLLSDPTQRLSGEPVVFSPSGQVVAYMVVIIIEGRSHPKLYLVNNDGNGRHALTEGDVPEFLPKFVCADDRLLINSFRLGNWEVYTVSADGSGPVNLSNSVAFEVNADLDSDCQHVVFQSDRNGIGNNDLFLVKIDGSDLLQLTTNTGNDDSPFFSPNGSRIGYLSRPADGGNYDLWVMNSDGTGKHKVSGAASQGAYCCPIHSFSPGGGKLLFNTLFANGNRELFTVDVDGGNLVNISNDPAVDDQQSFRP